MSIYTGDNVSDHTIAVAAAAAGGAGRSLPGPSVASEKSAEEHASRQSHSTDVEKRIVVDVDVADEKKDVIYVEYEEGDPHNPVNFTKMRKWTITLVACVFTGLSAAAASSYNLGFESMLPALNCTQFQATVGLAVYPLGFGIVPLVTAPFSEELGRRPLYLASSFGFLLMHVMVADAKNIQTVILGRLLGGGFGSTGATMVGGTIADIWRPHERGLPMSIFAVSALTGTGLGPVASGWIEANPHLRWRWIQWFHVIVTGGCVLLLVFFMKETRTSVILTRRAKKLRKETGDERYRALAEVQLPSLKTLLFISCTRPLRLLLTEPVVASVSLWIGFAWGILYCMVESIGPAFQSVHHFGVGETGTIFITITIGSVLGFLTNLHQETLYQRGFKKRGPEARLYYACGAGVLTPIGMFIYAWTTYERIPWIAMAIGIVLFIWATFIIYLASFTYLADCYGPYASSAIAGQSLCRNMIGMAFPLFTRQMFAQLTYKWGNTLFGCVAVLMTPLPLILFFYGPAIRARSTFSRLAMETQ